MPRLHLAPYIENAIAPTLPCGMWHSTLHIRHRMWQSAPAQPMCNSVAVTAAAILRPSIAVGCPIAKRLQACQLAKAIQGKTSGHGRNQLDEIICCKGQPPVQQGCQWDLPSACLYGLMTGSALPLRSTSCPCSTAASMLTSPLQVDNADVPWRGDASPG